MGIADRADADDRESFACQTYSASKSNTSAFWGRERVLKIVVSFIEGPFVRKMGSFHPFILTTGLFYSRPCNSPGDASGLFLSSSGNYSYNFTILEKRIVSVARGGS